MDIVFAFDAAGAVGSDDADNDLEQGLAFFPVGRGQVGLNASDVGWVARCQLLLDETGNTEIQDGMRISYDSMLNKAIPSASQPYVLAGTGVPTFAAPQGSLYINITGGAGARLYMNSNGSTTWIVAGSVN